MRSERTWLARGLLAVVLVVSLFLRLSVLDVFLTSDEDLWHTRSQRFSQALREQNWAKTYQSGHPGVFTMWLGTLAERLDLGHPPLLSAPAVRQLMQAPAPAPDTGLPALTIGARALVALVSWLSTLALYPLVRRLFGERSAILATVLVALDPFLLGHSRLHHLDALLTTVMVLSLFCLLVYQLRDRRWPYLAASGTLAGLAVAAKSPGVFLVPCAGLVLLVVPLIGKSPNRRQELLQAAGALALWGLAAAVALVAIWPAMWVSPLQTLLREFSVAKGYAESPHECSNYFWFAVRPDPGLAFYPVAWLFRTTPFVLLGLLGWVFGRRRPEWRHPALLTLLPALLFTAAMTVGMKKFDRYLLPVFPLLDILAAVGWAALLERWGRAAGWSRATPVLATTLAIGQFILLWPARPYYITYYNPAVGGSRMAPRVLVMGWGEGLDQAAAYLNAKPNADKLVVSSWQEMEMAYFFRGRTIQTLPGKLPLAEPDYYALYCSVLQRELMPEVSTPLLYEERPEYKVALNGVDYVWVCENTLYRHAEQAILERVAAEGDPQESLIVVGINAAFARHYSGEVPLQTLLATRHDIVQTQLQQFSAGRKHLWHIVYPDATEGAPAVIEQHLREQCTVGDEITVDGVRAVRYDLPAEPQFVRLEATSTSDVRLGNCITFLGYQVPTGEFRPGETYRVRLYWRADAPVPRRYTAFVQLIGNGDDKFGQSDSEPQAGALRTDAWTPGEIVLDDHDLFVEPHTPPGDYALLVGLYDTETWQRLQPYDSAGNPLSEGALRLIGYRVVAGQ